MGKARAPLTPGARVLIWAAGSADIVLRASFISNRSERELRELVRYRKTLTEGCAHEVHRVQKLLEGADIRLGDVLADAT